MRELIKKIVERLYYKCYPDRVNDHEIATSPIPTPIEKKYKYEKLIAETHIPREYIDSGTITDNYIRGDLASRLAQALEDQVIIECKKDYKTQNYIYQGYIRIVTEDQYE